MRGSFKIAVALCLLASSALAGILYQHRGISGSSLYPPQENLSFWGTGIDGTNVTSSVGSGAYVAGSNCKEFDGINDFLTVNNSSALGHLSTNDFVISGLADLSTTGNYHSLISKIDDTTDRAFDVRLFNTGHLYMYWTTDGSAYVNTTKLADVSEIPQGKLTVWEIRRSSGVLSCTIDGVETYSSAVTQDVWESSAPIVIGARSDTGTTPYDGKMSQISLSISGATVFDYRFASGQSDVEIDISGNGNHGTYTTADPSAMAVTDNTAPAWNLQYGFSRALLSNGTDDYISTGITMANGYKVRVTGYYLYEGGAETIFGAGAAGSSDAFFCSSRAYYGSTTSLVVIDDFYGTIEMESDGQYCYVRKNGELIETVDNGSQPSFNNEILIYCRDGFGTPANFCDAHISRVQIWDEADTLLKDYQAKLDGEFWEAVGETSVGTSGAGTLTVTYTPALSDGSADAIGSEISNPAGLHNGSESTLQVGSDNYSYADMIAMGPTTNGVIDNLLVYTNAPSSTAALDIWCEINSGVYTNTAP